MSPKKRVLLETVRETVTNCWLNHLCMVKTSLWNCFFENFYSRETQIDSIPARRDLWGREGVTLPLSNSFKKRGLFGNAYKQGNQYLLLREVSDSKRTQLLLLSHRISRIRISAWSDKPSAELRRGRLFSLHDRYEDNYLRFCNHKLLP